MQYADSGSANRTEVYEPQKLRDRTEESRHIERGPIDLPFFLLTMLLLTIGVVMVLSASFARAYYKEDDATGYFVKQLFFAVSGVALMLVASRFPMSFYRRISRMALIVSLVMLALVVPFGVGRSTVGANRWFDLGITTFQPSELAKVAIILEFSTMICRYKNLMGTFKYGVMPFALILVVTVGLLMLEPHISASVIVIAIGAVMMFAGGTRWQYFVVGIVVVGTVGYFVVTKMGYASARITSWLDPWSDPRDTGLQIIQSLYAIGSGGLLGLGLGQSRQKYMYLPEEHNDFIFPIVCEELGFIGAMLILVLFALLVIRGYWLAVHARDRFSALVAVGITSKLAIQVVLNVAVVTNLIPCTGISLPFFSYGGTALWIQLIEMGIVLAISREIPLRKQKNEDERAK